MKNSPSCPRAKMGMKAARLLAAPKASVRQTHLHNDGKSKLRWPGRVGSDSRASFLNVTAHAAASMPC